MRGSGYNPGELQDNGLTRVSETRERSPHEPPDPVPDPKRRIMTLRTLVLLFAMLAAMAAPSAAQQAAPAPLRSPDVIFVPTPQEVVDAMLKLAKVGPNDVI
jgi:hypothetical protein